MNVEPLIQGLEGLGIRLSIVEGKLRYEGPEDTVTPEIVQTLKVHKAEIMNYLRRWPPAMPEFYRRVYSRRIQELQESGYRESEAIVEAYQGVTGLWKAVMKGDTITIH